MTNSFDQPILSPLPHSDGGEATNPKTSRSIQATLARRTVDLLVIGWVVAVGVSTGRQFHDWWREDESPVMLPVVDVGEEWMSRSLDITVGPAGMSLYREPFVGSRNEVVRRMVELAEQRCRSLPDPTSPPDDAERELLQAIARSTPVISSVNPEAFVLPTPMPAVVIKRKTQRGSGPERLLGQAFAMPAGERLWTLFVMPIHSLAETPAWPASVQVLLTWSDPVGNTVAAVRGDGPVREVLADFDQRFGRERSVFREEQPDAVTVRYRTDRGTVDVRLQPDRDRGWHGAVWISAH